MPLGQQWAVEAVRELMRRPERDGVPVTRDVPILVVEGAHGGGKSLLLTDLGEKVDQRAPWARVDFAALGGVDVPQVLSALAFQLGRSTPHYGEIECPRLAAGLTVMQLGALPERREAARAKVVEALARQRDPAAVQEILATGAGAAFSVAKAAAGIPVPAPSGAVWNTVARGAVDWAASRRRPRRVVLGEYQDWYGHQGRGRTNNSLDALIDLNQWSVNPGFDDNRRKVGRLLGNAFLTDVRDAFDHVRHPGMLTFSALILLDNADTPLGIRFLNVLAEVRDPQDGGPRPAPAPLVFAATSRGALLANAPKEKVAEAGYREKGILRRLDPVPAWLRLRLADLAPEEIATALAGRDHPVGDEARLTAMITGLTGGHPESVRLLVDAMDRHPHLCGDLAALLDTRVPADRADPPSVGAEMVRGLLGRSPDPGDAEDDPDDDLAICAAAISLPHALWLGAGDDPLLLGGLAGFDHIERVLWPPVPGAAPALLRRLLLRRLALLDGGALPEVEGLPDPQGPVTVWGRAFDRMRQNTLADDFPAAGEEPALTAGAVDGLYYALAMGDLGEVATSFGRAVGHGSSATWLAALGRVVLAPRRPRRRDAAALSPMAQAQALAARARVPEESLRPIAELVAALWVLNDPFLAHHRNILHTYVNDHLTRVAARWPRDIEPLYEAAKHHRTAAADWD